MKCTRYHILEKLIKKHNWTKGAEIGIWQGDTFFYLLENCPSLTMVGVDKWQAYDGFGDKFTTGHKDYNDPKLFAQMISNKQYVQKKVKDFGNRARILCMCSLSAAEHVDDKCLDFVFIDADHRASFVRADIAAWRPKLKEGGKIIGHDYIQPGVKAALKDYENKVHFFQNDHVWTLKE